jgi:hypothetical protein
MIKQLAVSALAGVTLTACTSLEERDAHRRGQIEIVKVQKDSQAGQAAAESMAKVELYKALAQVAMANPEQASAVTVALAVQGLGEEGAGNDTPLIKLQPLQNEGLEFAKVFAAPLMNTATAVATAYINADVAKTQSDNAAEVQINDALQDSRIVEAVAGVGLAAAESSGLMVNGDNYTLSDSASISQDTLSTVATTTTTTETTTETNTSSELADSYNTLDNTRTQTFTPNTTVTFEGSEMTLADLVTYLSSINSSYSLTVGDEIVATSNDEADEPAEDVTCVPTFEGYQCNGG